MKIVYTPHLEFRLRTRNIPYNLPSGIFKRSKEHYYDILTKHYIAVHKIKFKGKNREMALTYDRKEDVIEIVTVHPIKVYQKYSRIHSGRWKKI